MTAADPAVESTLALHERHHACLRELLFRVLEALVAVDAVGARVHFRRFVDELAAGLALEDDIVLPAYRPLQPERGPGRADVVDGDHVILRRGLGFVDALVDEVEASPSLRVVLEGLPHVYRLLGTLEHHTERELRHVYPVVVPALDPAARAALHDGLLHLVDGSALP
jgi:hypothetical protein